MEREKYDILISELIYKSLTDNLKGNEADILEAWLQNPDNQKFYMDLKNSDRLFEGLREMRLADTEPSWEKLSRQVAAIRRRRRLRWLSAAAACLLVGLAVAWLVDGREEESPVELARREASRPGPPAATCVVWRRRPAWCRRSASRSCCRRPPPAPHCWGKTGTGR